MINRYLGRKILVRKSVLHSKFIPQWDVQIQAVCY